MSEKECVPIIMGKFSRAVRNRIIELNNVDQPYFEGVVSYFGKKCKENSYNPLTRARFNA